MKSSLSQTWITIIGLTLAMAATRFNHFGSASSLPDASWAVFFLGGLYLARYPRTALALFTTLVLLAGLIDSYVTTMQGVSDWCITPAYWFLIPTYGSLWFVGRWFALHHSMDSKGWGWLTLSAWLASSFAFFLSNASFYLVSGRVNEMTATEYVSRVSEYYVSYVSMSMLYIVLIVGIQTLFNGINKSKVSPQYFAD
jgi:hypothetical protein